MPENQPCPTLTGPTLARAVLIALETLGERRDDAAEEARKFLQNSDYCNHMKWDIASAWMDHARQLILETISETTCARNDAAGAARELEELAGPEADDAPNNEPRR